MLQNDMDIDSSPAFYGNLTEQIEPDVVAFAND